MSMFWRWEKHLPKEVCELILAEKERQKLQEAKVGYGGEGVVNPTIRNNKIFFLESNHWLEGTLINYARYANASAGWNYVLSGGENVQLTNYKAGELYDWHTDSDVHLPHNGYTRKLSVIAQICAPSDFTGGGLFLDGVSESLLQNQGDVVVFPSYMKHKAAPVESGERTTAVLWMTGPAFV